MIPLLAALIMLQPGGVRASDGAPHTADATESILDHMDKRRDEVRRALLNTSSLPDIADERRRLSPAERSVLSREWRESMHNIYEDRPRKSR